MAAALAAAHGGPAPVVTGEYRLGDVRHITASSQRLRSELGWRPEVGFAEAGMAEFAPARTQRRARRADGARPGCPAPTPVVLRQRSDAGHPSAFFPIPREFNVT